MTNEIPDPNLLRCAIKKTTSVVSKHILYASYMIVAITVAAIACMGIFGVWQAISPILERLWQLFAVAIVSIPWYLYGIAAIAAIYFGYSLLWCMARNLTDEDWQSEKAKNFWEDVIALALALAIAAIAALAITIAAIAALALAALALAALAAIALAASPDCKALLFIGAYLHYRKRMKNRDVLELAKDYNKEYP